MIDSLFSKNSCKRLHSKIEPVNLRSVLTFSFSLFPFSFFLFPFSFILYPLSFISIYFSDKISISTVMFDRN